MLKRAAVFVWFGICMALGGCQVRDIYSGSLILNGEQTLDSGKTLDGDLIVVGGEYVAQPGSMITGGMRIIGGRVEMMGQVKGDVFQLDGTLRVDPGATIEGDLVSAGGVLMLPDTALVGGKITRTARLLADDVSANPWGTKAGNAIRLLLEIPLLTLIGLTSARFFPGQLEVIRAAALGRPLVCAANGLLSAVAGLSLAILMAYTVVLIPVSLMLLPAMLFTATFGAVPAAVWAGRGAVRIFHLETSDPVAAALGMGLLALLAELIRSIPFAGSLLVIGLLLTAFGAALLTHFGSR